MKLLFTSHKFLPDVGGIEVNSAILAQQFSESGVEVTLVTNTREQSDARYSFNVIRAPSFQALTKLASNSDVIYQNNVSLSFLASNVLARKPVVIAVRTWIRRVDGRRGLRDHLKLQVLRRASAVIYISNAIASDCDVDGIVIGNPYRDSLFKIRTPLDRREKDIVFLGRLVSDKGVDILLNAAATLRNNGHNVKMTIIGDGPEKSKLQQLAVDCGIDDSTEFSGMRNGENLVQLLNQHKILAVPSRWAEPFGNVALEGLACGCVPVVSSGGGLPEAAGRSGVVFKSGDAESLAKELMEVSTSMGRRLELLESAEQHLAQHTEQRVSARYLDVIRSVLISRSAETPKVL